MFNVYVFMCVDIVLRDKLNCVNVPNNLSDTREAVKYGEIANHTVNLIRTISNEESVPKTCNGECLNPNTV